MSDLLFRAKAAKALAARWLLDHVGNDGKPAESDAASTSWSRLPWAFALSGETAAGHAVLSWAEREGIDKSGQLSAGHSYGIAQFPAYAVGHLAMGASLLQRFDLALNLNEQLRIIRDHKTGGMRIDMPGGPYADLCDLLSSAQAGLAALLAGQNDIADGVFAFIRALFEAQPEFPRVLYSVMRGRDLVTAPPETMAWGMKTDFRESRQSYFSPGIAAVFLAAYARVHNDMSALSLGHKFLRYNLEGTEAQFNDLDQVQICKFGWGIAAMQIADPAVDYSQFIARMTEWFLIQQDPAGNWAPSRFFGAGPTLHEKMVKTAEHLMELDALIAAAGALAGRGTLSDGEQSAQEQ